MKEKLLYNGGMNSRPYFDPLKSPKHQSEQYYVFINWCLVKVNQIRQRNKFSRLNRKALFRFVKTVYKNDWNSFLKALNENHIIKDMERFGTRKFKRSLDTKRRKGRKKRVNVDAGYVYVITNPAWPEWVKVGSTVSLEERLSNYQTSDPTRSYVVYH